MPADLDELRDEHIVPFALNGNMILKKASCKRCARITSAFEGTVTREQFGAFRAQRDYQTRRKLKRAREARRISYTTEAGEQKTKMIPILDYPTGYIAASYAPPDILTGAEPSDGSPPMTVATMIESQEMAHLVAAIGEPVSQIVLTFKFAWRPFSLTLAKIAHSFFVAAVGITGYVALLPESIIGEPGNGGFLSFYVGGYGSIPLPDWMFARHHIQLELQALPNAPIPGLYAVAHIALVGGARMSTYQVVTARITDYSVIETATLKYPSGYCGPISNSSGR